MKRTFIVSAIAQRLPWPSVRVQATVLFLVLMVATGLLAFRSIDDLDYGIHIGTGRWILKNGKVPTTDPFTWSMPDHLYVAYHWGFQVIAAWLYQMWGHLGPVVLRFVMVLMTAAFLARSLMIRQVNPVLGGLCGLLALVAAELRFAIRPELFTYLFLALVIVVLDSWKRGSTRVLVLVPCIFIGWVNTHIYILGCVLLAAQLVEQVYHRRCNRAFLCMLMVTCAALFLNPYGLDAVMEPMRLFTRMSKNNIFAQHITELASPLAVDDDPRRSIGLTVHFAAWWALLTFSVPASLGLYRAGRFADMLVLALFGGLSLVAVRNIPSFAVIALPLVSHGLTLFLSRQQTWWQLAQRYVFNFVVVAGLVLCLRVSNGAWYAMQRRSIHMEPRVERAALALDAAEFIERANLQGRGFNNFNVGGSLILGAPSHPIYIDGRNEVTGEAFFRYYLDILEPARFDEFLQNFSIEYVVLSHTNMMRLVRHIMATNNWKIVYYDSVAVVFVRKDGVNAALTEMPLPAPVAGEDERWLYMRSLDVRANVVDSFSRWLLGGEELPQEKQQLGAFLLIAGRWAEAERPLLEAAAQAPHFWETTNNLGALYMRMKAWELTSMAYRMVLMLNPSDTLARERLDMSWHKFKQEVIEK